MGYRSLLEHSKTSAAGFAASLAMTYCGDGRMPRPGAVEKVPQPTP